MLLLLAIKDYTSGTATYYPAYDGNGNLSQVFDSSGSVVSRYEYDPFGNPVATSGTYDNPMRFSTKYYDVESGLYYHGYRYYRPTEGRWFSRDPLGEVGGTNLYAVIKNDAVNSTDYLGLAPGEEFKTYEAAYKDAASYNLKAGKDSLDKGWTELENLTGLNRANLYSYNLPMKYKSLVTAARKGVGLLANGSQGY